ncbi:MAG: PIN domain-containing protein [bacterium]|nr:PIN domain-containing protein [bacterium]
MYTTDSHGLIWHLQEASGERPKRPKGRLGPRARRIFTLADDGREVIAIPSIVLVELVYLSERGVIPAALIGRLLADLAKGPENYRVIPLDLEVVDQLRSIPATIIPDMPDRIIAATAKATRSKLLSRDAVFRRTPDVDVVW